LKTTKKDTSSFGKLMVTKPIPQIKVSLSMIMYKAYFAQLPKEIKQGFSELNIGYHL